MGLARGLFKSNGSKLRVPDFTQLSRRAKTLQIKLKRYFTPGEPIHLVVDSTGLKIYGEGEWKVRTHGADKRRVWKKLHIAMNANNFEILDEELTTLKVHDARMGERFIDRLLKKNEMIRNFRGDGAYDTHALYFKCEQYEIEPIIPPRKGAKMVSEIFADVDGFAGKRDRTIFDARSIGIDKWKELKGYHRRSLVECQMSRYKRIIGGRLKSRNPKNQATESRISCNILNRMASLGMPDTIRV